MDDGSLVLSSGWLNAGCGRDEIVELTQTRLVESSGGIFDESLARDAQTIAWTAA